MSNSGENNTASPAIAAQLSWASQIIASALPTEHSAHIDSKLLMCHCLGCEQSYLYTWPDKTLSPQQLAQYQQLTMQRAEGMPIAHLLGYRDFWSLRLSVSDATLIPRPETELLVEQVLQLNLSDQASLLDLGTGTGAIALALASERAGWQITGLDKSKAAVELATKNAQTNHISTVSFICSDWFSEIDEQHFDVIVSNPPYVENDSPYLKQGDVRYEPLSALISGDDGLDDIRLIIKQGRDYLKTNGWLVLEHGYAQDTSIRYLFESNSYVEINTILDLNGLPRVTMAKKSSI